ncbi:MAG: OmpA family protein [Bacteroidetes bacterium]|nr:OmpA family protein [Bacteroidota bacterium]
MKKIVFLFLVFSISCSVLHSQNLVVNGDFESKDSVFKPKQMDVFSVYHVAGFYNPTYGSPDFYMMRNQATWSSQIKILPHSGNSFAGFISSYSAYSGEYYEYVGGELTVPLVTGQEYLMTFYLALYDQSNYSIDSIGIHFSGQKLFVSSDDMINPSLPHASSRIKEYFTERGVWRKVSILYTAKGGEKYFVLGDFTKCLSSTPELKNLSDTSSYSTGSSTNNKKGRSSYYYIDDISLIAYDDSISAGKKIIADDIHFASGDSTINSDSYWKLDLLSNELSQTPKIKVEIDGHTDSTGTTDANQKLSEARARAVKRYFVSKGIDAKRITTKGYGSSKPLGKDPAKNRRVEFIFSE